MPLKKEEIQRKILHFIFGTIIPAGIFYIPLYSAKCGWNAVPAWTIMPIILAVFLAGFISVEALRRNFPAVQRIFDRYFGSMLRKEETHKTTGATYINASALICSVLFKDYPQVSFMVISTFIWGDAVAALVGQSIGRIRIGKKSLEGSIACFMLCLIFFFVVFSHVPMLLDSWDGKVPVVLIFVASLCITGLELVPIRITKNFVLNDNLVVPVITGLVMIRLFPILK